MFRTRADLAARSLTNAVVAAVVIGVGAATLGLGGLPAGATARPPTSAGYRAVVVGDAGFRMAIPNTWISFDFTQPDLLERYHAFKQRNPSAALFPPTRKGIPADVQLLAGDPTGSNEVSVTLGLGMTSLPSLTGLRAPNARVPENLRNVTTFVRIGGRRAMQIFHPCGATSFSAAAPPSAAVSCSGSDSFIVAGRQGLLTFNLAPVPRPGQADADATTRQRILSSISLH